MSTLFLASVFLVVGAILLPVVFKSLGWVGRG
jgi:hypothetical protein